MNTEMNTKPQKLLSRRISIGLAVAAVALGLVAVYHTNQYPRTDDSEILANFIGIAPQVEGRLVFHLVTCDETGDEIQAAGFLQ